MGNPAEETYCYPNDTILGLASRLSIGQKIFLARFLAGFQIFRRSYWGKATSATPPQSRQVPVVLVNCASHRGQ